MKFLGLLVSLALVGCVATGGVSVPEKPIKCADMAPFVEGNPCANKSKNRVKESEHTHYSLPKKKSTKRED